MVQIGQASNRRPLARAWRLLMGSCLGVSYSEADPHGGLFFQGAAYGRRTQPLRSTRCFTRIDSTF